MAPDKSNKRKSKKIAPKPPAAETDDAALFHAVMKDAKPLAKRSTRRPPEAKSAPAPVDDAPPQSARAPASPRSPRAPAPPPPNSRQKDLPPLSHGVAPGLDRRTVQRLGRGRIEIEDRLDLHGKTMDSAHILLDRFLASAQAAGMRCVLVVTGKGIARESKGVLREAVPRWLNEAPNRARVLSFTHAQPADGGTGALYVLLRRLK